MAEARSRERWSHTSTLLALIANCHRDPQKHATPYKPADFDPFSIREREQQEVVEEKASILLLKKLFVDRGVI